MVPKVMTLVDAKSGQTKVRVTWTETEREAIERNLQHLLEKLEDGDDVILELCKHLALFPSSASLAGKVVLSFGGVCDVRVFYVICVFYSISDL